MHINAHLVHFPIFTKVCDRSELMQTEVAEIDCL